MHTAPSNRAPPPAPPSSFPEVDHGRDTILPVVTDRGRVDDRRRQGGIKLTPEELRVERPGRGHLHVGHGAARLTDGSTGPTLDGDVFPPLEHAHVYRVSDETPTSPS
jgi:hypothetical protein